MKLDFVEVGLESEELRDLLELAVNGEIREPTSPLGEHINEHWTGSSVPRTAAGALDPPARLPWRLARPAGQGGRARHRLRSGTRTFGYVQPDRDAEPIELSREPSWAGLAYRR